MPNELPPVGWKHASEHPGLFLDGDQYLVAVPVRDSRWDDSKTYWEYAVIAVHCDEDYFAVTLDGESWGWEWGDVEFYVKLSEFRIPGLKLTEPAMPSNELPELTAELTRLDGEATGPPWETYPGDKSGDALVFGPDGVAVVDCYGGHRDNGLDYAEDHHNAALIVAMRNALPRILRDLMLLRTIRQRATFCVRNPGPASEKLAADILELFLAIEQPNELTSVCLKRDLAEMREAYAASRAYGEDANIRATKMQVERDDAQATLAEVLKVCETAIADYDGDRVETAKEVRYIILHPKARVCE